jgi:hypothetical protein
MKLSSARDLKASLMCKARECFVESREAVGRSPREVATIIASRAPRRSATGAPLVKPEKAVRVPHVRPRPVAAFGIAPTARRGDYALAVRVFKGRRRDALPLIEKERIPEGEINLATGIDYRPRVVLSAGGSCGHYRITAGTLGGFVEDDERYYILSNNHVLANCDAAAVNDPIIQPGPADVRRNRSRTIAHLHAWVPLGVGAGKVDAAIARFSRDVSNFYPWWYAGIGETKTTPIEDRLAVRQVIKRGRTTRVTRGEVSAFDLDGVAIDYSEAEDGSKVVTFDNQLEFVGTPLSRPFSQPGDSGSFILDARSLRPYALLYGGGEDDEGVDRTLGQFFPEVLDELGVRIVQ